MLAALPDGVARSRSRSALRHSLVTRFRRDFVPDGGHKHALVPGSNLARLRADTVRALRANRRVASLIARIGYASGHGLTGSRAGRFL